MKPVLRRAGLVPVLVSVLLAAGCGSAPLSSQLALSQLRDDDIVDLEPTTFRVAIDIPDNVIVDPAKVRVGIRFTSSETDPPKPGEDQWPVERIASGVYIPLVVRQALTGRRLQLFTLSAEAKKTLERQLFELRQHPGAAKKVGVSFDLGTAATPPAGTSSFTYSAWIQLREQDGPLLQFEDRVLSVGPVKS